MGLMDVVPAHLSGAHYYDGNAFGNVRLRPGEVQAIYGKNHAMNVSKKFTEYDVYVQHRANHTAVSKMYNHVYAMDAFGGIADTYTYTLRADASGNRFPLKPGLGSKVLILCLNGENDNAVIIGGIRDSNGPVDDPALGHHLHWRFNGIDASINKDGELVIEYQGAQNNDGSLADGVDEKSTGTTITFSKDGNVEIADAVKDGDQTVAKNLILLDHVNSKIVITADKEVNVNAVKITHGAADADQPAIRGNDWKDLMGKMIDAIAQLTVTTGVGVSTSPNNVAVFQEIKSQLGGPLSDVVFLK